MILRSGVDSLVTEQGYGADGNQERREHRHPEMMGGWTGAERFGSDGSDAVEGAVNSAGGQRDDVVADRLIIVVVAVADVRAPSAPPTTLTTRSDSTGSVFGIQAVR